MWGGPVVHEFKPRKDRLPVGLTIGLRGNELSLESLYRPACLRRTLRQIEEEFSIFTASAISQAINSLWLLNVDFLAIP